LLGFLFDFEDEGDMFLRNFGLSPNYTALQPRKSDIQHSVSGHYVSAENPTPMARA
jgi:hypothetical protein